MSKTVKIKATGEKKPLRTCNKCGYVYFAVSRQYAIKELEGFNQYVQSIPVKDWREGWGKTFSTLKHYLFCWCGNPYFNFRKSKKNDYPNGCTINPILYEPEEDHNGRQNSKQAANRKQKS